MPSSLYFPKDGYVDIGSVLGSDDLALQGSNATFMFWIRPVTDGGDVAARIISKETSGNGTGGYSVFVNTPTSGAGENYFSIAINGTTYGTNALESALAPNVWQHVMCGWDGSVVFFYVNGDLMDERGALNTPPNSTADVRIGSTAGVANRRLQGYLRDLSVHNTRLTAGQGLTHIQTGVVPSGNLIANWLMEDGSGSDVVDEVGNWDGVFASASVDPSWSAAYPALMDAVGGGGGARFNRGLLSGGRL